MPNLYFSEWEQEHPWGVMGRCGDWFRNERLECKIRAVIQRGQDEGENEYISVSSAMPIKVLFRWGRTWRCNSLPP